MILTDTDRALCQYHVKVVLTKLNKYTYNPISVQT